VKKETPVEGNKHSIVLKKVESEQREVFMIPSDREIPKRKTKTQTDARIKRF
jgi:hypothetical protein